ncbi:KilA protein [Escherichia phage CY1_Cui-2023]|nr:KilA protein [Escherichia phage CY1_Cui-2023]
MKMNLTLLNEDVKMNSYQFLNEVINPARLVAGESDVRHNDFVERIEDELEGFEFDYESFVIKSERRGGYRKSINSPVLNMEQMLLVGMRESKSVRRAVLNKLKEMQSTINKQTEVISQMVSIDELKEARVMLGVANAQNAHLGQRIVAEQRINEILLMDKNIDEKLDLLACEARQSWVSRSDEMEARFRYEAQCFALKEKTDALAGLIENKLGIDIKPLLERSSTNS